MATGRTFLICFIPFGEYLSDFHCEYEEAGETSASNPMIIKCLFKGVVSFPFLLGDFRLYWQICLDVI